MATSNTAGTSGNPVQHVVIIVKENHTFDNYFGQFPGAEGDATLPHVPQLLLDPVHTHAQWLRRKTRADRHGYGKADIPAYWAYAQRYTLCDHYFTEIASQSEPNHLALIAANSPLLDNWTEPRARKYGYPDPPFTFPSTLPDVLAANGLDWRDYRETVGDSYFRHIAGLVDSPNNVPVSQLDRDAAAGTLPAVSWAYAPFGLSEHPPRPAASPDVSEGVQWTVDRVNAIASGPLWASTVIFITWDDWGGWYDHVDPPGVASWPDDGTDYAGTQFRYGSRVPCLVLSPYAKRGYISKQFHSHVSLVKFCQSIFGLPSLGGFDADPNSLSDDMWDCFDFSQTDLTVPGSTPS
jgi:phospholipase C